MVLAGRVRSVLAGYWGACLLLAMAAAAAPAVAAAAPEEQQLIARASAFERELARMETRRNWRSRSPTKPPT